MAKKKEEIYVPVLSLDQDNYKKTPSIYFTEGLNERELYSFTPHRIYQEDSPACPLPNRRGLLHFSLGGSDPDPNHHI